MKHRLDYRFQAHDHRDYHYRPARQMMTAAPSSFRLPIPTVNDQGQEGSCGPNAVDGLLKFDEQAQGILPAVQTSRQFTYWITRVLMGTTGQDSGVDNRIMLKALAGSGFCAETLWPYSQPLTAQPSQAAFDAALPNALTSYAAVDQNLTTMKAVILAGRPFLFGFNVYQQFESDQAAADGLIAMPSGSAIGAHDIGFYGWDDSIQCPGAPSPGAFFALNSWGAAWGLSGCCWVPYAYAIDPNEGGDFWVVNAVPGLVPPAPPAPKPVLTLTIRPAPAGRLVWFVTPIPLGGRYSLTPLAAASAPDSWTEALAQEVP